MSPRPRTVCCVKFGSSAVASTSADENVDLFIDNFADRLLGQGWSKVDQFQCLTISTSTLHFIQNWIFLRYCAYTDREKKNKVDKPKT